MNEPYVSFSSYLKNRFPGQKITKIPINAGFLCPNKDGSKSHTGCIFCDQYGSGPLKTFHLSIQDQIEQAIRKQPNRKFIAYFQAHSNTYAPVRELKRKYDIVFNYPDIVGLFIGTRPDAINPETYQLLSDLNKRIYLTVELGLQSVHKKSLVYLNRNHTYEEFLQAFSQCKRLAIDVVVHLIVGIPGETRQDMLTTIREMNRLKPAGLKFHLFHILKSTPLFEMCQQADLSLLDKETYIELIIYLLENLDPTVVIHRLTGERDTEIFHAPQWALNKIAVINEIRTRMIREGRFQGRNIS